MRPKKLVLIVLILILHCSLWAADPVPVPFAPFLMLGHVDKSISLSIDIDDSVLPIDFSSNSVKHNDAPGSIAAGLCIGTFSAIANAKFHMYIAHTPFTLRTPTETGDQSKIDEIDYILYAFTDMQHGVYSYCSGVENASNPLLINEDHKSIHITKDVDTNKLARMINHSLFLSLIDEEHDKIPSLVAGIYESTIYFVLETE